METDFWWTEELNFDLASWVGINDRCSSVSTF